MNILEAIQDEKHYVADDGNVVVSNNQVTSVLNLEECIEVHKSLNIDKQTITDAAFLTKKQFYDKYNDKLKEKASLSCSAIYAQIRNTIVDHKIPISKKRKTNKRKVQTNSTATPIKGSRKDQVAQLLKQGMTSPSEIAKTLGTNASYVHRLIKQING